MIKTVLRENFNYRGQWGALGWSLRRKTVKCGANPKIEVLSLILRTSENVGGLVNFLKH